MTERRPTEGGGRADPRAEKQSAATNAANDPALRLARLLRREHVVERLDDAFALSRKSLDKIGEGDWTPQDTAHANLLSAVALLLDEETP